MSPSFTAGGESEGKTAHVDGIFMLAQVQEEGYWRTLQQWGKISQRLDTPSQDGVLSDGSQACQILLVQGEGDLGQYVSPSKDGKLLIDQAEIGCIMDAQERGYDVQDFRRWAVHCGGGPGDRHI
jgi:hypothetical protein